MANRISQEAGIATTVAIDKDKNSPHAVKWTLDNLPPGIRQIVLVHVHTKLQSKGAVQENIMEDAALHKHDEFDQFFLPYRGICARKGVRAKEVVLFGHDVASALAEYVNENAISSIALGVANRNAITRAFKHLDIPSSLAKSVPDFCTIYAVSKGRGVQIVKLANRPPPPACHKPSSLANPLPNSPYSDDLAKQGVSRCTPSSEFHDGRSKGVAVERSFGSSGSLLNSNSPSPHHPVYYSKSPSPQHPIYHTNGAMSPLPKQIDHSNHQFRAGADTFSNCATDFSELSGPASFISDASHQRSDASSCSFYSQAMVSPGKFAYHS